MNFENTHKKFTKEKIPSTGPHQHQYNAVAGRLMHHLKEVEGMSLRTVEYCVFDEADRLFEMGFAAQLREILAKMNESRQVSFPSGPHMLLPLGQLCSHGE